MSRVRVWSLLSELARVILRGDVQEDDVPPAATESRSALQPDPPFVQWQPRPRTRGSVWQDVQARALQARLVPCAPAAAREPRAEVESELPIPVARPAANPVPAPARPAPMTAAARTTAAVEAAIDWGPVMLARISDDFARRTATAD